MGSLQAGRNGSAIGSQVLHPAQADVKARLEEALERLSEVLLAHGRRNFPTSADTEPQTTDVDRIGRLTRFLGQVRAAWVDLPENALPQDGAGFGSTVLVEDLDTGVRNPFTLMTGALLDIEADQVSLASPIGQALLRTRPGDSVVVETPQRRRRFRVVAVRTLLDRITDELPPRLPAARS